MWTSITIPSLYVHMNVNFLFNFSNEFSFACYFSTLQHIEVMQWNCKSHTGKSARRSAWCSWRLESAEYSYHKGSSRKISGERDLVSSWLQKKQQRPVGEAGGVLRSVIVQGRLIEILEREHALETQAWCRHHDQASCAYSVVSLDGCTLKDDSVYNLFN